MKLDEEKVYEIFVNVFNVPRQQISIESKKDDFTSWDSIGHLQLIMHLESEFNIKFRTAEINSIKSIEDCFNILKTYIK